MSPTAAMNVAATMTLTPGTVISRLISGQDSASAAMSCSTAAISVSRKSIWRSARVDGLALLGRQLLLGQPAAALDAEQVRRGRAALQAAHQHRVDLVLGPRARANQLRAPRQAAAHRPDALVRDPDAIELSGPQQLGQRLRVEAVGLRAGLADAGVVRRDDDHPATCGSMIRGDRPRVASHLQRDPITRIEALREQLQRLGPGLDPPRRPQPALRHDRDLAEVAMDIQRDRSHLSSSRR